MIGRLSLSARFVKYRREAGVARCALIENGLQTIFW
jgi:hypothetical protein